MGGYAWCRAVMRTKPRIEYRELPDATPEAERRALGSVYSFILRSHEQRQRNQEKAPAVAGPTMPPFREEGDESIPRLS